MATETKKKSRKATWVGLVLLLIFAGITVLGFIFHDEIFGDTAWVKGVAAPRLDENNNPVFDESGKQLYNFTPRFSNSLLNTLIALIPQIVRSVQVLFVGMLILYVVCAIISAVFRGTPRRVTIGKLVNSIVKVVIWVAIVVGVLAAWGFNLGALIAGAGVLTLVVGLGMQSLIADVVAGIFIVCDGTLQVGDIVTIDGWRGTVQEIGIRNTKLINYSGDIRVANNSTIKVFINQSRENSYPTVIVGVPYEANLQQVKEVFEANKGKIKEMCPALLSDIDFNGVEELGESSVNLHFGATCTEADFFVAQRQMRGAIKTVFEENGISVPFPQIVLHEGAADKPAKIARPEKAKPAEKKTK